MKLLPDLVQYKIWKTYYTMYVLPDLNKYTIKEQSVFGVQCYKFMMRYLKNFTRNKMYWTFQLNCSKATEHMFMETEVNNIVSYIKILNPNII